jgi:GT2 family glycosyltransferase
MPERRPIVAAIPTWNMAESVTRLVGDLQSQNFDRIFVLDDKSQDDTIVRLQDTYGSSVEVVEGWENLGAAGNRNRIMGGLALAGFDESNTLITFIDADVELLPSPTSLAESAVRLAQKHPYAGIIGGKILNTDDSWSAFNYGPGLSREYFFGGYFQAKVEALAKTDPEAARAYRQKHAQLLRDYPDVLANAEVTRPGWVMEPLTVISADTFGRMNGYDPRIYPLEAVDLGERLRKSRAQVVFDPGIEVRHTQIDVRGKSRRLREGARAMSRLAYRHATGYYR